MQELTNSAVEMAFGVGFLGGVKIAVEWQVGLELGTS